MVRILGEFTKGEAILFYDGRLVFHIKSPFIESQYHQPYRINKPQVTTNNNGLNLINQLGTFLQASNSKTISTKYQQDDEPFNSDIMSIKPKL